MVNGYDALLDSCLRSLGFSLSPAAQRTRRGVVAYCALLHMWLLFRHFVPPECVELHS